jgi:tRNA uridine 5-carbamoylmethylation protein Kti12
LLKYTYFSGGQLRTFILLSAIPGAGKSTFAANYARTHNNVYIVSSDEVRKEITGSYQNFEQEPLVWETFRCRIHELASLAEDATVIADGVNDSNALRISYAKEASEFGKKILVYIERPIDIVLQQNTQRLSEKRVPNEIILLFAKKIEPPSKECLNYFDEYIEIKS